MKREIIFRGKDEDSGGWVHGSLIDNCGVSKIFGEYNDEYYVDSGTVGQYTGSCDIHKKEIFEDDIVRVEICDCRCIYRVAFKDAGFVLMNEDGNDWYIMQHILHCDIEVIGNIHDNPDLLKGGEV